MKRVGPLNASMWAVIASDMDRSRLPAAIQQIWESSISIHTVVSYIHCMQSVDTHHRSTRVRARTNMANIGRN